jgi:hypothetical protein
VLQECLEEPCTVRTQASAETSDEESELAPEENQSAGCEALQGKPVFLKEGTRMPETLDAQLM